MSPMLCVVLQWPLGLWTINSIISENAGCLRVLIFDVSSHPFLTLERGRVGAGLLGIEARSPALQSNSLPSEPPGKPPIQNKKFFLKKEGMGRKVCFKYGLVLLKILNNRKAFLSLNHSARHRQLNTLFCGPARPFAIDHSVCQCWPEALLLCYAGDKIKDIETKK